MTGLQNELHAFQGRVTDLQNELLALQRRVTGLQKELHALQRRVTGMLVLGRRRREPGRLAPGPSRPQLTLSTTRHWTACTRSSSTAIR